MAQAIGLRENRREPVRQRIGAAFVADGGQRCFDPRLPAAHHRLQLGIDGGDIRHQSAVAQIECEAQQRRAAFLHRYAPAQQPGIGAGRQQCLDGGPPAGRYLVARQPDKGEQMPLQRRQDQPQFGAWPVGNRHGRQRNSFQLRAVGGDQQVVRQLRQHMRQRLPRMAARIETEFACQFGQCGAQHRHPLGRSRQRRTCPQPGMDRQAGDAARPMQRHDDQVDQHAAVDGGGAVGFDYQRHPSAALEPFDRCLHRAVGQQRRVGAAADAQLSGRRAVPVALLIAQQGEIAVEEPAQQRRRLAIADARGIVLHRALQFQPVAHRRPDIAQHLGHARQKLAAAFGVGALDLHVDHRFAALAARFTVEDVAQRAARVAPYRHHRVDDAIDRQPGCGDRARHRIDQKRHIVIDDGQPHPPRAGSPAHLLQRESRLARFALHCRGRNKCRRLAQRFRRTGEFLVRQRAIDQHVAYRRDDGLRRAAVAVGCDGLGFGHMRTARCSRRAKLHRCAMMRKSAAPPRRSLRYRGLCAYRPAGSTPGCEL